MSLSVNRIIKVSVNITPKAALNRGFGTLMILGDSDTINQDERYRSYASLTDVAADFLSDTAEYKAAQLYFAQSPSPSELIIGRWVRENAPSVLKGAILSDDEQDINNFEPISNGIFKYSLNGEKYIIDELDFDTQTNLNGVASVINSKLSNANIIFDGGKFILTSNERGANQRLGYLEAIGSSIDIANILALNDGSATKTDGKDAVERVEATAGTLTGSTVASSQLSTLKAITDGSLKITIDGEQQSISNVDLSSADSMQDIASTLQSALTGVTVQYSTDKFIITSNTKGSSSSVSVASAGDEGTTTLGTSLGLNNGTPKAGTDLIEAKDATAGTLKSGSLPSLVELRKITNGAFKITIDSLSEQTIKYLDFSSVNTYDDVASEIQKQLENASIAYQNNALVITSNTTGASSVVSYATNANLSVTDISTLLKMTKDTGLKPIAGADSESALQAVQVMNEKTAQWYGLSICSYFMPSDDELVEIAKFIEGLTDVTRIFGITVSDTRALERDYTDDIASKCKELKLNRTCLQYSQTDFAICSFLGRAFTVNFNGSNTTLTMMYKEEPSVEAEDLTNAQADVLEQKRCNVYVKYNNDSSMIQYGVMAGDLYFDERHGSDWLQNATQTAIFNAVKGSSKIPQTDEGLNSVIAQINAVLAQAETNGFIGAGVWNGDNFGQLQKGDYLPTGYYVYAPPMASQSQADRDARISPPIQVAAKLQGALHTFDVSIDLNR